MQRILAVCAVFFAAAVLFTTVRLYGGAIMIEFQTGDPFPLPWPWTVYASFVVMGSALAMAWAVSSLIRQAWSGTASPVLWATTVLLISGVAVGSSPIWLDYPLRFGVSLPLLALGLVGLTLSRPASHAAPRPIDPGKSADD